MTQWHPIFLTSEPEPGIWTMKAAHEVDAFGRIEIRRTRDGIRYRVTHGGDVIGWATSLQVACERLYREHLDRRAQVYKGPPNGTPRTT